MPTVGHTIHTPGSTSDMHVNQVLRSHSKMLCENMAKELHKSQILIIFDDKIYIASTNQILISRISSEYY